MKGGEGREGLWPKLEARTRILSVGTVCVACDMVCRNARIMRNTENVGMSWRGNSASSYRAMLARGQKN